MRGPVRAQGHVLAIQCRQEASRRQKEILRANQVHMLRLQSEHRISVICQIHLCLHAKVCPLGLYLRAQKA